MTDIQNIPLKTIKGTDASLADYAGKVVLVVNVASKCGLTPQYEGLEKLYADYRDKGLVVAGFPANDFGAQEPGSNDEIATFCTTNFGVDFPMFSKIWKANQATTPLASNRPYRSLASMAIRRPRHNRTVSIRISSAAPMKAASWARRLNLYRNDCEREAVMGASPHTIGR